MVMGIESVSSAKSREKPPKNSKISSIPVISLVPIGPKIMDFEAGGTKLSKNDIQKAKDYYGGLHGTALGIVRTVGLPPKPNSKEEVLAACAAVLGVLWNKVRYADVDSLLGGISEFTKYGRTPVFDCDTSAFFTADVFRSMGLKTSIIHIPGQPSHAVLGVELANKEKVFIETTSGKNGDVLYHPSKPELEKRYGDNGKLPEYAFDARDGSKLYAMLYNARGAAKIGLGDHKGAIADNTQAIKLGLNSSEVYYNRGNAKIGLGDHKGAIADYTEAIRVNPKNALAYNNRGNAKEKLGDHKGALADCSQAIMLNPSYASAFGNRANAKISLGDHKGAIADSTEAIRLDSKDAKAHCSRGNAKIGIGDHKGAIADYTEAIRFNPNDSLSFNNRGSAKISLGDHKGAIADYTEAIRLNPMYADAYVNRSIAKQNLGDLEGAKKDLEKAKSLGTAQNKQ